MFGKFPHSAAANLKETRGDSAVDSTSQTARRNIFQKIFKEHPASVGETYLEHMAFAAAFAATLLGAALAALIHAFVPALFETTASRMIRDLYHRIENRGKSEA